MRCVTPASDGRSSRAPTPTQTPTATERTDGDRLGDDAQAAGQGCLLVHGPEPTSCGACGFAVTGERGANASTTSASNCVPACRRSSASATVAGIARR